MSHHGNESSYSPLHDFDIADDKIWEQLKKVEKRVLEQRIGKTGRFPQGKLREDDQGEVMFAVGSERGKVVIQFAEPTKWVGMDPQQAMNLASALIKHARTAGLAVGEAVLESMNIKAYARWLFRDALNLTVTTRLWTVNYGNWTEGRFKSFWTYSRALRFALPQKTLFVTVRNEATGEEIIVRRNPEKKPAPIGLYFIHSKN